MTSFRRDLHPLDSARAGRTRGPLAALRGDRELKRSGFAGLFLRSEARHPLCHFVAGPRGPLAAPRGDRELKRSGWPGRFLGAKRGTPSATSLQTGRASFVCRLHARDLCVSRSKMVRVRVRVRGLGEKGLGKKGRREEGLGREGEKGAEAGGSVSVHEVDQFPSGRSTGVRKDADFCRPFPASGSSGLLALPASGPSALPAASGPSALSPSPLLAQAPNLSPEPDTRHPNHQLGRGRDACGIGAGRRATRFLPTRAHG
jgi:hypothetical protein